MADDHDPGERTELAGDRTILANERTLGAWWRTAISALALALGFAKLFGGTEPGWLIRTGASVLVLLAVVILWVAMRTYLRTADRIQATHAATVSRRTLWFGTLLLVAVALISAAAVWLV